MQNNRNPVISNQIAERLIRDILGLRYVTLSRNVQNQHDKENAFVFIVPGPESIPTPAHNLRQYRACVVENVHEQALPV